ncbi:DUF3320 domain-containing protein [Pontibacter diazotrophicus]|uniref:DUF3320 domain-containing protein n=1 Tax=Pontibacter diazotrophicus TaxID=1400979 RepID=A0A3D8L213_9BACT|nr:DUF3320 domain-containing protein [Pontibacter diazotrophicus]RDV11468.1 DUF3320 domain-containing protein [Pontibacter diazotrophicus]
MTAPLETEFIYSPSINFAMQQNHVSVVRKLWIKNTSEIDLQNISIELTNEPAFAAVWQHQIDILKAGESFELNAVHLKISSSYLSNLSERISGNFTLVISAENHPLFTGNYPVSVLAYDQWSGAAILPEMIAAFITPNHAEVQKIIRKAAPVLERWTGSPSFDEYQSRNPDRVRKQMAALYEAIAELQLVYCSVPASFEENGQRIRMCDTIFSHKLANCLDISLLYAACLEAVGIHPLLVFTKGHAFIGGWLTEESFADPVNDDPSLLTKRTAEGIDEIVLVEATCMNAGKQASFDEAVAAANQHMKKEEDFRLFVDIKRTRFSGIRPLPLRVHTPNGWETIEEEPTKERKSDAPEALTTGVEILEVEQIKVSKQRLWERKLLDLTLRNNLLNIRLTKGTLQLISINLSQFEDSLASGQEFQVLPKPADWDNPLRNTGIYQALNQSDPIADLVKHEFTQKRLRSYLTETELQHSLTNIYRSSRQAIEENGANTLYIALGLLKWYETPASERPRYAPILLLPVEIIRKSAQKGYVIRSREEETMMNITLLEMLRQDFGINIGGLENLPKDESGVDVKLVFNIIRKGIMSHSRWDVEEQALLGTFSFSKFILWNDIHNNADKLSQNKIVKSLISGMLEWQPEALPEIEALDSELHPAEIALPISTDSSQFAAILSSAKDKSFVLHGPPGTGKSQTITNIIANALYAGKKVLFVSAKKAALDVVEKRLESIGIGSFCLELHSNKSKKSAVLEQLKRAAEINRKSSPQDFEAEAERLLVTRTELNGYVQALHQKYGFGFSLFEAFTQYSQLAHTPSSVSFTPSALEQLTPSQLAEWQDIVDQIQVIGAVCGHPHQHPLEAVQVNQYAQQLKTDARQLISSYQSLLSQYHKEVAAVCRILKIEPQLTSREQAEALSQLITLLLRLPDVPASLLNVDHVEQTLSQVLGLTAHGKKRDALSQQLLQKFNKTVLSYPAEQALQDWTIADQKWFLPKFLKQSAVTKGLKKISLTGSLPKEETTAFLQQIIDYQAEKEPLEKATHLPQLLGFLWQDGTSDWDNLVAICTTLIDINRQGITLNTPARTKEWRNALAQQFSEGSKAYLDSHKQTLTNFQRLFNEIGQKEKDLHQLLGIDFGGLKVEDAHWVSNSLFYADKWLNAIDDVRDWINWLQIREKAIAVGLQPLISVYENGGIAVEEITLSFKKGLYRSCAEYIIDQDPQLSAFNGKLFEEKIRKFRELSNSFEQLTKEELYARLAAKVPSFAQEASQSSEIGILQRNIRNNGRATSIRKLFDSIPNLLPRLCPCMLMSPISVAQYFDANSTKFDLVVFDEASQMPTCEAVGAIARGTNVIVVGDPKQMPPTSFFGTNAVDEDNIELEDLESILDDCLALSMPSHYLLWHYRSKHESLIAFSNAKYYDNQLLTFPSTDDITTKVQHVAVEGFYDKGKTRQNQAEAKAIVEEIIQRLSHPEMAKRSLGIVTFSVVQQNLIEDLLTEVFKARPDLEKAALETEEPLFIKNLENVQGDERDVILFSVGYGPDKEGKVSLNFGPINREGGWRRLNVAVSRARYEMKVFSTLRSDQIDITRTASEGVAGLKAFLAYAEKGKSALPGRSVITSSKEVSFENTLAEEIRKQGYEVHTAIGCSDYKIDIGVVNPANPSEYVLGILCDGHRYYSAKTSRDREIVQADVLRLLGWNIHKIWSIDWWENPERTVNDILMAIKQAEEQKALAHEPTTTVESFAPQNTGNLAFQHVANNSSSFIEEAENTSDVATVSAARIYEVCQLETVLTNSSEDFLQPLNCEKVAQQIIQVVNTESPISQNLLCRRVLAAWGISRNGSRVNTHFENLFPQLPIKKTQLGKSTIFWKDEHNPDSYSSFRVSDLESQKREADDLPPEEVANGVREILVNQISLPKSELIREVSRLFGYARLGANVEAAMTSGIAHAVNKGYAIEENERLILAE